MEFLICSCSYQFKTNKSFSMKEIPRASGRYQIP